MLIGLSGYARSGKDSAAQALVDRGFTRVAFADVLRNILYTTDPFIPILRNETALHSAWRSPQQVERLSYIVDDIGWDDAKDAYPEIRRLLQVLGTEGGREILGDNIWVETALKDLGQEDNVCVTDVRFSNEGDYIRQNGGVVVKIVREGFGPINSHISDNAMELYKFDHIINNDGSLQDLHDAINFIADMTKESA